MKKLFIVLLFVFLIGCSYLGNSNHKIEIMFVNGEEITKVNFEEISEFPSPEKEGFTFEGWYLEDTFETEITIGDVTESVTLYAKFEVAKYNITFYHIDGSILKEEQVEYNQEIVAPIAPIVEGYVFSGWDKEFDVAREDLDIVAQYTINKFRVVFLNHYGDIIKEEYVNYNENATAPDNVEIEHYTFTGWNKSFKNVTSDLVIRGIYEKNKYTVVFKDFDNRIIRTEVVEYQGSATSPTNPTRNGYTFKGWDNNYNNVDKDITINAIYEINKYTVVFKDYNGVIISSQEVEYMKNATAPESPTRQDYQFVGWDKEFNNVTDNLIINAIYYKSVTTITFNSDGGTSIAPITISNGSQYNLPVPTKQNAEFIRWIYNRKEIPLTGVANFTEDMNLVAVWAINYLSNNDVAVKYRKTTTDVKIPSVYTEKEEEFRGMWVSNLTSDIASYTSKDQMMRQLTTLLDNLEKWNMNALVYHIRINNDALYPTDLSPRSSYVSKANFEEWDYLEWLIEECHKRNIEFHAWLNPYRIVKSTDLNSILNQYKNYPLNPASKAENIIVGKDTSILNPGEPAVRKFLLDTCMEVIEKYDVDAIHFDDYFYVSMNGNADLATYNKYKGSSSISIEDWRREQINIFIRDLSTSMRKYNKENNRDVELGISPSGVYRNDAPTFGKVTYDQNGTAITNGSNTAAMEHYAGYLFADTKKWIDEEWIDYICPQSYWGFTHTAAGYADVIDWWVKVVKYKNVRLYSGMGIYMTEFSWGTNPYEASDQLLYNSKFNEIDGVCIFRYGIFLNKLNTLGVKRIFNEYWTNKVSVPK